MRIGIPKETQAGETRVAATPETVKKLVAGNHQVVVERGAGTHANIPDREFEAVGATLVDGDAVYRDAEIVLKVRAPSAEEAALVREGAAVIGLFSPFSNPHGPAYNARRLTCFAMELLPRITRAQSMDVLSSQANLAGYKAVLEASHHYQRFFPMLMTAAGTVKPARLLVLGAGVAGLQAIATARRLGAVVEAFDVRAAAKEQVESLGAKFVEVPVAAGESETSGGYAREMSDDYKRKQAELVHQRAVQSDIVITTALIPGKPAPRLLHADTVRAMRSGSVIVDMAAEMGGNCELTQPGQVADVDGVIIIGHTNLPAMLAADASALYARNLLNFLSPMLAKDATALAINRDDEVIAKTLFCHDGQLVFQPPA